MDELFAQLGLLLTQVRFSRRALEDIERNTATFGGMAFLKQLTPDASFGQPPLLNGALKVYVVNINDLTSSNSLGGVIEGIVGGVGRFIGGVVGGAVGGTISGTTLPLLLVAANQLAGRIDKLLDKVGFVKSPSKPKPDADKPNKPSFLSSLPSITDALLGLTALFRVAASGPGQGGTGPTPQQSAALGEIHRALQPVEAILNSVERIINGTIFVIPLVTGALASFIDRLSDIKLAFIEFLQFLLQNIYLLGGVVVVTLFETLSSAARLGAGLLRVLASAVDSILAAVFNALAQALKTALSGLALVANGISVTIQKILPWLLKTVHAALSMLGQLPVFRIFFHIVDILPNILPSLIRLVHDEKLTGTEMKLIEKAASKELPDLTTTPTVPKLDTFPDVSEALAPTAMLRRLVGDIEELGRGSRETAKIGIDESVAALQKMGQQLDEGQFLSRLDKRIGALEGYSKKMADALEPARQAIEDQPKTDFSQVADAFGKWFEAKGLDQVMSNLTEHFAATSANDSRPAADFLRSMAADVALERARATVEIEEVVIDIKPLEETATTREPSKTSELGLNNLDPTEWERRGGRPGHPAFLT